jgi:hypothetical protein
LGVAVLRLHRPLPDQWHEGDDEQDGDRDGQRSAQQALPPRGGDLAVGADGRAGQHEGEKDEDDDRADVDEDLDQGHELGAEDDVAPGDGAEADDQPERRVDDVARGHGEDRADRRDHPDDGEDDVAGGHDSSPSVSGAA